MNNIKHYFKKARAEYFAVPQFNFSDFTQMKAIVAAAEKMRSPVILGTSEGESKFFGLEEAVAIRDVLRKKTGLPIFLNLDHGKSFSAPGGSASGGEIPYMIKQAIDAGYDMVHFDGSKLPLEENIRIAKEIVKYARKKKITVEGEVGRIGTDSSKVYLEKFEIKEDDLTKPEQAKEFIDKTGVSLLAVSIGSFHGVEASGAYPNLRLDLLKKIKAKTGDVPLVLHGGSGIPESDIKEAVKNGIVKININTELRVAFVRNLKDFLIDNKDEVVPYKFLLKAKDSVEKAAEGKIILFGSANKA